MGVLPVLLVVAVSLVSASASTSPPPVHEFIASCPPTGHSLVSLLLQGLGYSDVCVATALETCAPSPQQDGNFMTVMMVSHTSTIS